MSVFGTKNAISMISLNFNIAMTRTFTTHLAYQLNKAFHNEHLLK